MHPDCRGDSKVAQPAVALRTCGPFRLIDPRGKVRRDTDFRGRLMLVYFGFTSCPDICPTDLQQIGLAS